MRTWFRHRTIRRGAFTLVELMVVVAIIALLISILLPSLAKAREQAYQVKCAAHLSSIFKGFFYYTEDPENKGYLPQAAYYTAHGYWPNQIMPYIQINRVRLGDRGGLLRCPADEEPELVWITGPNAGYKGTRMDKLRSDSGVGNRGGVAQQGPMIEEVTYTGCCDLTAPVARIGATFPRRLTTIKKPYCFPILGETAANSRMCFQWKMIHDQGVVGRSRLYRRHYGGESLNTNGSNWMFADGHVQWHSVLDSATKLLCCIDFGGPVAGEDPNRTPLARQWKAANCPK
jgi:prepilin-type N-terminal cleavage/methylation domain-containing protein/prepilin-type processing-associated H-X9-DG protein